MKILLIGATGSIGRAVRTQLLQTTDYQLVLTSRHASTMQIDGQREVALNLDARNAAAVAEALTDVDAVFVAVSGALPAIATAVTAAMTGSKTQRLVFISSMGIYDEIPARVGAQGNLHHNPVLRPYREAADIIAASTLNYTVIRPGWFDNGSDDYEVTREGAPFGGHDVSRRAIAQLVVALLADNQLYARESIGINRPQ